MSYADLNGQRSMAFDDVRNEFYEAAIKNVVTTDSVVLDLGSGLGVHALMAARAGAKRVFMVEPENVVHCAKEIAKHNGYGDRVEAFQGRIEEVELPEKVDVIISVFTGNLLYSEDLLPSLYYARDKWLKPGGKLIPDAAELMLAPISLEKTFEENVAVWSVPHRGFDYSPLRRYAANGFLSDRRKDASGELLAPGQVIASADFYSATDTNLDATATFQIEKDGVCHGLHAWIRIHLGEQWAATGPIQAPMHWTPTTFTLDPPITLKGSQSLEARLRRPEFGEWTWTAKTDGRRAQHSTFLSAPILPSALRLMGEGAAPMLSDKGALAKFVIDRFDGRTSNSQIVAEVVAKFPQQFPGAPQAKQFVSALAARYGK
jgi:SAM-dependent methyltransferase